ncbi:FUSC family protein [Homoserinimonas sp. A447]
MRVLSNVRGTSRSPLLQVFKTSVAVVAAWLLSNMLLAQPLPIFAAIAALLVVQPSVNQSLAKGVERSLGVILGVILAYGAGMVFGQSTWIVLTIVVVSLLLAWALRLTPGSANQIPISAMLVLAIGGAQNSEYAIERVVETLIGCIVGLLINMLIVPPVLSAPAHHAVVRLATLIAATLDALSNTLKKPQTAAELATMLENARALRPLQRQAQAAITSAEESLLLNPRKGAHRQSIERDRVLMGKLAILVTRVLGLARAVHDRYDEDLPNEPMVRSIAQELSRAAHDLRLLADRRTVDDGTDPSGDEVPALTAPLVIAVPHPEHWILIGSLMEDIRRVREEITGSSDG